MDLARLRELLRPHIGALKDRGTNDELPAICAKLGIPFLGLAASKRERMYASFDAIPDGAVPSVAQQFIDRFSPAPQLRNEIQDLLWAANPGPPIPKRIRRELARRLDLSDLFCDASKFDALITSIFNIEDDPTARMFGAPERTLREQIHQHVYRNPGDWSPEELLERLGAYECSDRRFCRLLEGLSSADIRLDEAEQRRFVELVNASLLPCSVALRETGLVDGYPVFSIIRLGAASAGLPKNLIFASSIKPDLRFRDALNNDIEIVTNADRVLVYDRPISADGIKWSDLQTWWADRERLDDKEKAKNSLFLRMQQSLPSNSPAQKWLFRSYYTKFGPAVPLLPALIPEVWLHWDPKTVKERGASALARFRMDFLMLLPHGTRVVIEVDGKHHFADEQGRASGVRYGQMMAADRELRLAGYEVFRFGAAELEDENRAFFLIGDFFDALFKRYGIASTG